jgi:hypothetical protein
MSSDITSKKGKILIIEGVSQYNVLNKACHLMKKGLIENGYEVEILDGSEYTDVSSFAEVVMTEMRDNGLFLMSFNAIFHDFVFQNKVSLFGTLGFPTLGFLVDAPFYQKPRVEGAQEDNIYIGCVDHDHVSYINRYYQRIKHVGFLPHFSFEAENLIPYEERTINLYYPGSYVDPGDYTNNLNDLPKVFADIAMEIFHKLLNDSKLTLDVALENYLKSVNFECSPEEFVEIIDQIHFVDHMIRDWRRDLIVRSILDGGIEVTVCGKGWSKLKEHYPNLNIIGDQGIDIDENVKIIANSKILFNTFPNFKNGTHERIFTAMRNGCVCLTDSNIYTQEHFTENENIVYYDLMKPERLKDIINDILNNPEKAKIIAENGRQKAITEYSEKATAKHVLKFMGLE